MLTPLSDTPEEWRSGHSATSIQGLPFHLRVSKVFNNHRKMLIVIRAPCKISRQLKATYLTVTTKSSNNGFLVLSHLPNLI